MVFLSEGNFDVGWDSLHSYIFTQLCFCFCVRLHCRVPGPSVRQMSLAGAKQDAKAQAEVDANADAVSCDGEGEGEEEEEAEGDPEFELDSKWDASKHEWPILNVLSNESEVLPSTSTDQTQQQNARVVPHSSADISWAERFAGALFYDNVGVKNPPATAFEDFKAFYNGAMAAASGSSDQSTLGAPCRNKIEAGYATFARGFESRDWTSVDEHWLRASFWGCQQLESDSDAFFGQVEQTDKRLLQGVTRLAARRHQAARPEHSQVGIMAAKAVVVVFSDLTFRFGAGSC